MAWLFRIAFYLSAVFTIVWIIGWGIGVAFGEVRPLRLVISTAILAGITLGLGFVARLIHRSQQD